MERRLVLGKERRRKFVYISPLEQQVFCVEIKLHSVYDTLHHFSPNNIPAGSEHRTPLSLKQNQSLNAVGSSKSFFLTVLIGTKGKTYTMSTSCPTRWFSLGIAQESHSSPSLISQIAGTVPCNSLNLRAKLKCCRCC